MNRTDFEIRSNFSKRKIFKKNTLLLLGIIILFGALLRFYGLGFQSLWTDELASWDIAQKDNLINVIDETAKNDAFPPGYYILLHYTQKYLGDSEGDLRLPSAICGVLSIIGIFYLGMRLYSDREALIAAIIMAVMWCPIYYSQEARAYIFLILFSILSVYYWIVIIESLEADKRPKKFDIIFYVLFASLCCYTHYFGGYLIALQGLGTVIFLFRKKKSWRYIILIFLLIGLIFSPWVSVFLNLFAKTNPETAISSKPITITLFIKFLGFMFGAQKSPFIYLETYSKIDTIISISIILVNIGLIVSLFFIKFYNYFIKNDRRKRVKYYLDPDVILILWLVIPYFGIYILAKLSFSVFSYRYLLISLPAAYLLLSRSIARIFTTAKLQFFVTILFVTLLAIHLIYYKNYFTEADKEQYREAVDYVVQNDKYFKESKIIGYTYDNFFNYYAKKNEIADKIYFYVNEKKDMDLVLKKINSIQIKYLWLISAHISPDKNFIEYITNHYKLIRNKKFIAANVWLFEKI